MCEGDMKVQCYDCELDYGGPGWIEAIIPDKVWIKISPTKDEGGILCINCISRRLEKRGYKDVPVWLTGTEPLQPMIGNTCDQPDLFILRNWPGD